MLAAYHGHAELVTLLIQHGADPNRLNDRGQSPLAGAVFKKEDDVINVSWTLTFLSLMIECTVPRLGLTDMLFRYCWKVVQTQRLVRRRLSSV